MYSEIKKYTKFRTLNLAHCDLKVSSSQEKIEKNFANYLLKTKAK